jgi:hypothetical protein
MEKCKCCGQIIPEHECKCMVYNCYNESIYEGWYRRIDPLTNKPSGTIWLIQVCKDHKSLLIGAEK